MFHRKLVLLRSLFIKQVKGKILYWLTNLSYFSHTSVDWIKYIISDLFEDSALVSKSIRKDKVELEVKIIEKSYDGLKKQV
jgi:hypothetical protein